MAMGAEPVSGFYQAVLYHLQDIVFRTDPEGRWDFLNPAWAELTGFGVGDSLGRSFLDYVHPGDRQAVLAELRALVKGDRSVSRHEARARTADGGWRWMAVQARPMVDGSGRIVGVLGTLNDITERKALEANLAREREQAQITLQAISEAVIATHPDGRVRLLNREAERLLGLAADEAMGRPLSEVFRVVDEEGAGTRPGPVDCIRGLCPEPCSGVNAYLVRVDGSLMAVDWSAAPLADTDAEDMGWVVGFRDVRSERALKQELAYQATHDGLTGLLNRAALQEAINHQEAAAQRTGSSFSLLLFDLDQFKVVNDNYGHAVGDQVLVAVAERIRRHVREADWFGRWGGEEFLCLLPDTSAEQALRMAERVRADIVDHPLDPERLLIPMSVSVGLAASPDDGHSGDELLRAADTRLFEAKRGGRNRVEAGQKGDRGTLFMGGRLHQALGQDRIVPAYQPIVDLASGEAVSEEALARLVEPGGDVLAAGAFIEAASNLQIVHRIDEVLLNSTMERCSGMLMAGRERDHFVNISTELLRHRDRVDAVLERAIEICERCGDLMGDTNPLVIEITEREFVEDTAEVHRILKPFLDNGFRLAVDDFGSGYSSFRYLADLPVTFLKIEGELVKRAIREPRVRAILQGIRDIAGELGLITIAEMVEDEETADFLRRIGIDRAQGFHFARPAVAEAADPA